MKRKRSLPRWLGVALRPGRRRRVVVFVLLVALGLLVSHCMGWTRQPVAAETTILRVLLGPVTKTLVIEAERLRCAEVAGLDGCTGIEVRTQSKGLLLLPLGGGAGRAVVVDGGRVEVAWQGPARLSFADAPVAKSEREHFGRLVISADNTEDGDSKLRVVLHCDLEVYISGVVAAEMGASFPPAALAAQAIAARGFALTARARRSALDFDVFDDERDQVYRGVDQDPRLIEAVRATSGQVLAYQDRLLRSYYASTCGGATRDGHAFFKDVPREPMRGVRCDGCRDAPLFRWRRRIPLAAFVERGCSKTGRLGFDLRRDASSGDLLAVVVSSAAKTLTISAKDLHRMRPLPSLWIDAMVLTSEGIEVRGRGFGHRVGLCQYGARGYAKAGWSHTTILEHYFPGARLLHLSDLD